MLDIDIYKTILLMNILHKAFLSKSFKGRFPIQPGKLIVMRLVILSGCGIWNSSDIVSIIQRQVSVSSSLEEAVIWNFIQRYAPCSRMRKLQLT